MSNITLSIAQMSDEGFFEFLKNLLSEDKTPEEINKIIEGKTPEEINKIIDESIAKIIGPLIFDRVNNSKNKNTKEIIS